MVVKIGGMGICILKNKCRVSNKILGRLSMLMTSLSRPLLCISFVQACIAIVIIILFGIFFDRLLILLVVVYVFTSERDCVCISFALLFLSFF